MIQYFVDLKLFLVNVILYIYIQYEKTIYINPIDI